MHSSFATEHFQRKPFEIYYTENERRGRKDDYGALYRLGHVRLATHAQIWCTVAAIQHTYNTRHGKKVY